MTKCLLSIILSLLFFSGFCQGHKKRYKDQLEPNSKLVSAGYNFTIEKVKSGQHIYKTFFPETRQITSYTTYKTKRLRIRDGKYMEWFDDGQLIREGNFDNDRKNGKWKELDSEGMYRHGRKYGKWRVLNKDGKISEETSYLNDQLNGKKIVFDSIGQVKSEEEYRMGDLVSTTIDTTEKIVEVMPRFIGCENIQGSNQEKKACADKRMLNYIYRNIKYPKIARDEYVEGLVIIQFVITEKGHIEDIRPIRALCASIRDECVGLVRKMPKWIPGRQNGKPVKVQFNLPIKFNLE